MHYFKTARLMASGLAQSFQGRISTVIIITAIANTAIFQKSRRWRRPGRLSGFNTWISIAKSRRTVNAFDIVFSFVEKSLGTFTARHTRVTFARDLG
jgi:hypothetical protein